MEGEGVTGQNATTTKTHVPLQFVYVDLRDQRNLQKKRLRCFNVKKFGMNDKRAWIINKEIICIQVMIDTGLHEALVVVKYQIKESY